MRHAEHQWGITILFQHSEAGKLEEKLFVACVLEADVGLGILTHALHLEHFTDTETLVLDELSGGELRHAGSATRSVG